MFKLTLEADLRAIGDFGKFRQKIKTNVVNNGLDITLDKSLLELKDNLKFFINEEIRDKAPKPKETTSSEDEPKMNVPKSDAELLKYFTGLDIEKIRKTKDYTSSIESSALVVDDNRVRLKFPISEHESFEENYARAVKFMNSAMFVFADQAGRTQYYINPGIDLTPYVKVVCSRDTGITNKSSKKFEKYKNSKNMPRQGNSEIGRFAEWSLKQEGVQRIRNANSGFINISGIIDKIKNGDYEDAVDILKRVKPGISTQNLIEKAEGLRTKKGLTPGMETYTSILSLINNLKIVKNVKEDKTTYSLLSSLSANEDEEFKEFFDEIRQKITMWVIVNENKWFEELIKIALNTIKDYGLAI